MQQPPSNQIWFPSNTTAQQQYHTQRAPFAS
jgi:hypothetical protein